MPVLYRFRDMSSNVKKFPTMAPAFGIGFSPKFLSVRKLRVHTASFRDDTFIRFDRTPACDRQTDERTDRQTNRQTRSCGNAQTPSVRFVIDLTWFVVQSNPRYLGPAVQTSSGCCATSRSINLQQIELHVEFDDEWLTHVVVVVGALKFCRRHVAGDDCLSVSYTHIPYTHVRSPVATLWRVQRSMTYTILAVVNCLTAASCMVVTRLRSTALSTGLSIACVSATHAWVDMIRSQGVDVPARHTVVVSYFSIAARRLGLCVVRWPSVQILHLSDIILIRLSSCRQSYSVGLFRHVRISAWSMTLFINCKSFSEPPTFGRK